MFSNISGDYHFCKCFERKSWNMGFGTETPIPLRPFKNLHLLCLFLVDVIAANMISLYGRFLYRNPYSTTFLQKPNSFLSFFCSCHSSCPPSFSCLFLHKKFMNMGFDIETPIPLLSFKKYFFLHQFYVHIIVYALIITHVCFFKGSP